MAKKELSVGDKATIGIFKTKIKDTNDYCFTGAFLLNGKDTRVFVQKDYKKVVVKTPDNSYKCNMKKITPKDSDPFLVGRVDVFKLSMSKSKFFDENPEENPEYYLSINILDKEQLKEEIEKEAEYAKKEAEYISNVSVENPFEDTSDEDLDI